MFKKLSHIMQATAVRLESAESTIERGRRAATIRAAEKALATLDDDGFREAVQAEIKRRNALEGEHIPAARA